MQKQECVRLYFLIVFTTLLIGSDSQAVEAILGRFPLCEASAALRVACPGGDGDCLLVGDNEEGRELYLFPIRDQKINSDGQRALDLRAGDGNEISDIEALASVSSDEILVFASHSRNSICEVKPKRRQFGTLKLSNARTQVLDTLQSQKVTCEHLFDRRTLEGPMIKAACQAIDAADAIATRIEDALKVGKLSKDDARALCDSAGAYNAEGAVAIRTAKETDVWIGLRAPLLAKHPDQPGKENLAILLHMKDLKAYKFDRVAFVDLAGRGVRDLASDETSIWLIAGPPEDKNEPFQLRRFAKSALNDAQVIEAHLIDTLPSSSEGLVISGKTAFVVIDGDAGNDPHKAGEVCKEPARYKILSLPGSH
jgi:hypothetical protein